MQIKVELCESCAAKLREVVKERGDEAMGRAVGPIIAKCAECRAQLPGYKIGKAINSALKRPS